MSLEASNGVNLPRAKTKIEEWSLNSSQIAPLEVAVLPSTISNMMLNLHKFKENLLHIWYKQGAKNILAIKYRNV